MSTGLCPRPSFPPSCHLNAKRQVVTSGVAKLLICMETEPKRGFLCIIPRGVNMYPDEIGPPYTKIYGERDMWELRKKG